ncbi:MAG: OmpH family outer membrane protein [Lentisphaerae bacterium]|nr:OmpH family outer membrane protein [Lentisphaerota bacterium]
MARMGIGAAWVAVLLSATGWAAGAGGLAVVDMARLIESHPDTPAAEDLLRKQIEEFELEQKELAERGNAMRDAYRAAREAARDEALSEAGRAERAEAAVAKGRELQAFEEQYVETVRLRQDQLRDQERRMRLRIVGKLVARIEAYAREAGLSLVLDSAGEGISGAGTVIYADGALDITDAIEALIREDAED